MSGPKKVHWFSAPGKAPCGATGALRFSINPSEITCPRCLKGAAKNFGRKT